MSVVVEDICRLLLKDSVLIGSCNGYIQEVAKRVGLGTGLDLDAAFEGDADAIRARFSTEAGTQAPFHYIGPFPDKATQFANDGQFVVGGLTHQEMTYAGRDGKLRVATMGHVVVIAPHGPSTPGTVTLTDGSEQAVRGGYPYCYQGAHYSRYRFTERTQVDVVFPALRLTSVIYAYIDIITQH